MREVSGVERELAALRAERAAAGAASRAALDALEARKRGVEERATATELQVAELREALREAREECAQREAAVASSVAKGEDARDAMVWRVEEARRGEARARAELALLQTHQKFFRANAPAAPNYDRDGELAALAADKLNMGSLITRLQRDLAATKAERDELRDRLQATERAGIVGRLAGGAAVPDAVPLAATAEFAAAMEASRSSAVPPTPAGVSRAASVPSAHTTLGGKALTADSDACRHAGHVPVPRPPAPAPAPASTGLSPPLSSTSYPKRIDKAYTGSVADLIASKLAEMRAG